MSIFDSLILGVVEGITEFLPISSTGHLILTSQLLRVPATDFMKTFEVVIQLGAILAVVVLYAKKLIQDFSLIKKVFVAFLPTAIIGLALHGLVKTYLLGSSTVVVWALGVGGVLLILFERFHGEQGAGEVEQLTYKQAIIIGLCQSVAIIPGVSRAAATIIGGLMLGMKREAIVRFSFLLAIPTMFAASGYDLLKSGISFNSNEFTLLATGFITAFIVAIFSIKFLLGFIKNHTFTSFGIYRIALALLFFIWL